MKIAVFDSGIGGVTVLKELQRSFNDLSFYYFGDTANVPYGTKSERQIKQLTTSAALKIKNQNVDALVLACNTASAIAIEEVREVMGAIPVLSVVEAGVQALEKSYIASNQNIPLLVLGTKATIKSHMYSRLIKEKLSQAQVLEQACPLLVPIIEESWHQHPVMQLCIKEYVKDYTHLTPGIALLACTHYPWAKPSFQAELKNWQVIDSAESMAQMLAEYFPQMQRKSKEDHSGAEVEWYFSDPDSVPKFIF